MNRQIVALLMGALLLLMACGERQQYRDALSRAESLMNDRPDSALLILDSLGQHESDFGRHFRMQYLLHRTNAQNKTDVGFTSDSLANELVTYFDNHGTANERLLAHYLLGRAYSDMGEAPAALQAYYDALNCSDTTKNDCDLISLSRVYAQMSQIFHQQNLPHDEIWALQHFIALTELTSNKLNIAIAKSQLISPYYLLGEKDTVLHLIEDGFNTLKKLGYDEESVRSFGTSIYIYTENGDIKKAKELVNVFEHESGLFDENGDIAKGWESYYFIKGFYEIALHKIDSAEFYFRKAVKYGYCNEGYKGLLTVYKDKNSIDSIVRFANLYEAAQDTLHKKMQTDAVHQMSALYNYSRSQKEAEQERENSRRAFRFIEIIVIVALILFIIIIVISWLYVESRRTKRDKIAKLEESLSRAITQRSEVQEELRMLKEKDYEGMIADKEKQESTLAQTISLLRAENEKYRQNRENGLTDHLDDFVESSIAQLFVKKTERKTERPNATDAEWKLLETQFIKCMPALYKVFATGESLSTMEQNVCILILLGIPTNAIISLLNSSAQAVSRSKAKANMKLFGKEGSKTLKNNLFSALKLT